MVNHVTQTLRAHTYLASDFAEASEEVWGGVVISALSLDRFHDNTGHGFPLLPPLHDQVLHLMYDIHLTLEYLRVLTNGFCHTNDAYEAT